MANRLYAIAYLLAVLAATLWHSVWILLAGLVLTALACGRDARRIVTRALGATAFFSGLASLVWVFLSARQGDVPVEGIARLNMRVLLLTMLGQLAASRLDIVALLDGSPPLRTLAVLVRAQVGVFRRLLSDYRLAVRSRTCRRPGLRDSQRISAAAGAGFLRRAQHEAAELTMGLQSRGVFDDQG